MDVIAPPQETMRSPCTPSRCNVETSPSTNSDWTCRSTWNSFPNQTDAWDILTSSYPHHQTVSSLRPFARPPAAGKFGGKIKNSAQTHTHTLQGIIKCKIMLADTQKTGNISASNSSWRPTKVKLHSACGACKVISVTHRFPTTTASSSSETSKRLCQPTPQWPEVTSSKWKIATPPQKKKNHSVYPHYHDHYYNISCPTHEEKKSSPPHLEMTSPYAIMMSQPR